MTQSPSSKAKRVLAALKWIGWCLKRRRTGATNAGPDRQANWSGVLVICEVGVEWGLMTSMPMLAPVGLIEDLPNDKLTRGQIGTVVKFLEKDGEPALLVEFSAGDGQTYADDRRSPESTDLASSKHEVAGWALRDVIQQVGRTPANRRTLYPIRTRVKQDVAFVFVDHVSKVRPS